MSSNAIVASLGDVVLYSEDVDTLDEWLNDQIIDFYFEHLSQRFSPSSSSGAAGAQAEEGGEGGEGEGEREREKPSTVFVGASASFLCAHGGAAAVAGPLRLAEAGLVFLPVNDNRNLNRAGGGSHWSLLVFDRDGGEVGTAGGSEEESNGNGGGGGAGGGGAGGAEKKDDGSAAAADGTGKKKGSLPSSPPPPKPAAANSKPKPKENKSRRPVFRAYDSLGQKNVLCARELSSALEEHLILDDDDEEEEEEDGNGAGAQGAGAGAGPSSSDAAEERSRRLRQRRRLDAAASRTRSVAPPARVLNFVSGRCPRQGNASDCGIYVLALAERIAAGRARGLPYREIEEQLFREVTPSFAEEERERLRSLVEEVGREREKVDAAAKKKAAAALKKASAPKKKGG